MLRQTPLGMYVQVRLGTVSGVTHFTEPVTCVQPITGPNLNAALAKMRQHDKKIAAINGNVIACHVLTVHLRDLHVLHTTHNPGDFPAAGGQYGRTKGNVSNRVDRLPAIHMPAERSRAEDIESTALASPGPESFHGLIQGMQVDINQII